jgi:hypothetical protein
VEVGKRSGHEHVHPPQRVILRDHVVQLELIEQLPWILVLPLPLADLDQEESVFAVFIA